MNLFWIGCRLKLAFKLFGCFDRDLFMPIPLELPARLRLAMYLQLVFPDYNIDGEYRRFDLNTKALDIRGLEAQPALDALIKAGLSDAYHSWLHSEDTSQKGIVPDLIVHKRRKQSSNLLFIEIKPTDKWCENDSVKLSLVTSGAPIKESSKFLKYEYGLQLNLNLHREFGDQSAAAARIWKNGNIVKQLSLPYS